MSKKIQLFPGQILAIGFALIILAGGILLSLPVCSRDGEGLSFLDGLFTSASATCVTGLVVCDTFSQFNHLGQLVILLLIQIGGLGFIGMAMTVSFLTGQKISIFQRSLLMESIGTPHIGGVVRTIRRMLLGTLLLESAGALLLAVRYIPRIGPGEGLWYGVFHAVSAFCNAGFDLSGRWDPFSSMTLFRNDPVVLITVMLLIITGGIGFMVWNDILEHGLHFRRYTLHAKIMVSFTLGLIVLGASAFVILERNASLAEMSGPEKVLNAFFASVSPRTAGFNSVEYGDMTTAGRFLTMLLMFIGAGPGSTGGGIKITTFAALLLSMYSNAKNYNDLSIFRRRLPAYARSRALSTITYYTSGVLLCTFCLLAANPQLTAESCLFESLSAMGTVGLSMGITQQLGDFSRICLIILMYLGRLGSITVAMALARRRVIPKISYPEESVTIG
ncbi:MAG: TrkH family potassium uptake protein [Emergencia sp.]